MSAIETAVEGIHRWLRDHAPDLENLLERPLTRQEIDDLAGPWGYRLPEEAYTLYSWRNGLGDRQCLIPGYQFDSLAEALKYATHGDEFSELVGPEEYGTLPIFPTQYTSGGYTLFCDNISRPTGPIDYGRSAATDSLTDFLMIVANHFKDGLITFEDGELDFVERLITIGLDRDDCYHAVIEQDWETMSQAVLRIGVELAAANDAQLLRKSLEMFQNSTSRIWRDPLIQRVLMIRLNFSDDPDASQMMVRLLRHSDRRVRWRAAALVGNSQDFQRYHWMRPLADYLAEELAQLGLPPAYRTCLILSFGKTGDRRAGPLLEELQRGPLNNTSYVAGLCLRQLKNIRG